MIVYNDIKRHFVNDVKDNNIADKILGAIKGLPIFIVLGSLALAVAIKVGRCP